MGAFQDIMTQAYERYRANPHWSHQDFQNQLVGMEVIAIPLGNFNYQVENGGFIQWIDNGYAKVGLTNLKIGLQMIGTETAKAALELVAEVENVLGDSADSNDFDEDEWEIMYRSLGPLNSKYYLINEQLVIDADEFFSKVSS